MVKFLKLTKFNEVCKRSDMEIISHPAALFLDIGGVLLTNGWDHSSRSLAAETFKIDPEDFEARHHECFDAYEEGKLSLQEYLFLAVFNVKRDFTIAEFQDFMYAQSKPYTEMLELVKRLKFRYRLKVAVVNNEGRELNEYRIKKFGLKDFVDCFVSSCYLHFRKPDKDLFRAALDIGQLSPEEVIYIEDRPLFVEAARSLGINCIRHTSYNSTVEDLARFGLMDSKDSL